ncbi:MAG: SIMPL domain-containing protein [Acidimicrobiia bacterium]|nr:SIMPL domain-containing protein [Acidimicrobiia bacterium]
MTTRWTVATISAVAAAVAAVGVIATATNDDRAAATVPPDSVPGQDDVPGGDRTIVVSGHGTVTVTPDIANLSLGVQTTAPTGSEALDTIGEQSTALVATLKALGIADADLQTSGLSLWPQYSDDGVTINGYTASVNVNVTVRDIARVGEIVDAAQGFVGEGLTIGGIGFSYDEPETVLEDARIAAIENARVRAEQYAAAAGVSLGDIVRIIEPTSQGPVPVFEERFAADDSAAGAAVAIEPGSQDLAVDVTVVFAMA